MRGTKNPFAPQSREDSEVDAVIENNANAAYDLQMNEQKTQVLQQQIIFSGGGPGEYGLPKDYHNYLFFAKRSPRNPGSYCSTAVFTLSGFIVPHIGPVVKGDRYQALAAMRNQLRLRHREAGLIEHLFPIGEA